MEIEEEKYTMESTAFESPTKSILWRFPSFLTRSPKVKTRKSPKKKKKSQVTAEELILSPPGITPPATEALRVQFEESERKIITNYESLISSLKDEINSFKTKELNYQKVIAEVQLENSNFEASLQEKNQQFELLNAELQTAYSHCQQYAQQIEYVRSEYALLENNFNECCGEKIRVETILQDKESQLTRQNSLLAELTAEIAVLKSDKQSTADNFQKEKQTLIDSMNGERGNLSYEIERLKSELWRAQNRVEECEEELRNSQSECQLLQQQLQQAQHQYNYVQEEVKSSFNENKADNVNKDRQLEEEKRVLTSNYESLIATLKKDIDDYKDREFKIQNTLADLRLENCNYEAAFAQRNQELANITYEYQNVLSAAQNLEEALGLARQEIASWEEKYNESQSEKNQLLVLNSQSEPPLASAKPQLSTAATSSSTSAEHLRAQFEDNERKIISNYDSLIAGLKNEIDEFKSKELSYQKLIAEVQLESSNLESTLLEKNQQFQALNEELQNALNNCQLYGQQVEYVQQEYALLEQKFGESYSEKNRLASVVQELEAQIQSSTYTAAGYTSRIDELTSEIESLRREISINAQKRDSEVRALQQEKESFLEEIDRLNNDVLQAQSRAEQYQEELQSTVTEYESLQQQLQQTQLQCKALSEEAKANKLGDDERRTIISNYDNVIATIKREIDDYKEKELKYMKSLSDLQLENSNYESAFSQKNEELTAVTNEYQMVLSNVQSLEEGISQMRQELVLMEERYNECQFEKSRTLAQCSEWEGRASSLQKDYTTAESIRAELSSKVSELTEQTERLSNERSDILRDIEQLQSELSISKRQEAQSLQQYKNLQNEYAVLQQQLDSEYQSRESIFAEYNLMQSQLYSASESVMQMKSEYNQLMLELERVQSEYQLAKAEAASLRKDVEACEDRIRKYFTAPQQHLQQPVVTAVDVFPSSAPAMMDTVSKANSAESIIPESQSLAQTTIEVPPAEISSLPFKDVGIEPIHLNIPSEFPSDLYSIATGKKNGSPRNDFQSKTAPPNGGSLQNTTHSKEPNGSSSDSAVFQGLSAHSLVVDNISGSNAFSLFKTHDSGSAKKETNGNNGNLDFFSVLRNPIADNNITFSSVSADSVSQPWSNRVNSEAKKDSTAFFSNGASIETNEILLRAVMTAPELNFLPTTDQSNAMSFSSQRGFNAMEPVKSFSNLAANPFANTEQQLNPFDTVNSNYGNLMTSLSTTNTSANIKKKGKASRQNLE